MGLTVTEKNHWKDRIALRIDKRIEAIYAEDPNLRERVEREARAAALASLKLGDFDKRLAEIKAAKERLEKEERRLHAAELATVRGIAAEDIEERELGYYCHSQHSEVKSAIERRQAIHAAQILAQEERGRTILQFQEEKENLLDTVWLATSSSQLKELWSKVNSLLGATSTRLEQDALAIPPVEDE